MMSRESDLFDARGRQQQERKEDLAGDQWELKNEKGKRDSGKAGAREMAYGTSWYGMAATTATTFPIHRPDTHSHGVSRENLI